MFHACASGNLQVVGGVLQPALAYAAHALVVAGPEGSPESANFLSLSAGVPTASLMAALDGAFTACLQRNTGAVTLRDISGYLHSCNWQELRPSRAFLTEANAWLRDVAVARMEAGAGKEGADRWQWSALHASRVLCAWWRFGLPGSKEGLGLAAPVVRALACRIAAAAPGPQRAGARKPSTNPKEPFPHGLAPSDELGVPPASAPATLWVLLCLSDQLLLERWMQDGVAILPADVQDGDPLSAAGRAHSAASCSLGLYEGLEAGFARLFAAGVRDVGDQPTCGAARKLGQGVLAMHRLSCLPSAEAAAEAAAKVALQGHLIEEPHRKAVRRALVDWHERGLVPDALRRTLGRTRGCLPVPDTRWGGPDNPAT